MLLALFAAALMAFPAHLQAQENPPAKQESRKDAGPASVADLSLDQVVEKLQENYEKIKTYRADFSQELFSTAQGRVVTRGEGAVVYKKPGMMKWEYTLPEEHVYIIKGDTIWDYSPEDSEAYVLPVGDALYKSFLLGLGDISADFEISFHAGRKKDRQGRFQLDLVPREKKARETIGTITIKVSPEDFLVRETQLVDPLGNRNTIRFKNMKMNPEVNKEEFEFQPPPGTEVIKEFERTPPE